MRLAQEQVPSLWSPHVGDGVGEVRARGLEEDVRAGSRKGRGLRSVGSEWAGSVTGRRKAGTPAPGARWPGREFLDCPPQG